MHDCVQEQEIEKLAPPGHIIHLYQQIAGQDDSYGAAMVHPDSPVMGLDGSYSMISDHMIEGYKQALQVLNQQQGAAAEEAFNKDAVPPPPPPPLPRWRQRISSSGWLIKIHNLVAHIGTAHKPEKAPGKTLASNDA